MYKTKYTVDYYNRFLTSIKSPFTRSVYDDALRYYMKDMDVSEPNELIEVISVVGGETKELEDNLIDYITYLDKEKHYSYSTIHNRLAAIYHFYTINRVNLNKSYVSKFMVPRKRVANDSAYTREQIQKILSTCNLRHKVMILLMVSTGMRVGALHLLKLSALTRVDVPGQMLQHLYRINVYETEAEKYYTFCTFECAAVIDQYLEYRKRSGEVLKPDAPLLREEFDRHMLDQIRNPRHISYHAVLRLVDEIIIRAGIKKSKPRKEGQEFKMLLQPVKRCHGFRKFAITQMIKAKVDYNTREFLVGHKHSRGLDENYDRTNEEDRLEEYLKAVNFLTINEENRLRKEVQEKEHVIKNKLLEKEMQIQQLTDRMIAMEQAQKQTEENWGRAYDELKTLACEGGTRLKKALAEEEEARNKAMDELMVNEDL